MSSRVDQPKVEIFFTEALIYFDNLKKGTKQEVKKQKTKKTMKKKLRGGKEPEHYFCARNITNSYF